MHLRYFPLFTLAALSLLSSAVCQTSGSGRPCTFDFNRPDVPNCIYTGKLGSTVSSRYLRELVFDQFGLAPVYSHEEGWMYVNRRGRVVLSGVARMDNWADTFHDGLVRVVRNGKYGFANRKGTIVVPAAYDGALNFENGAAEVCNNCRCDERDSEHCALTGGQWSRIDTSGRVLAHLKSR
jgi:hypothetical protein